jgi:hypothetical protein
VLTDKLRLLSYFKYVELLVLKIWRLIVTMLSCAETSSNWHCYSQYTIASVHLNSVQIPNSSATVVVAIPNGEYCKTQYKPFIAFGHFQDQQSDVPVESQFIPSDKERRGIHHDLLACDCIWRLTSTTTDTYSSFDVSLNNFLQVRIGMTSVAT